MTETRSPFLDILPPDLRLHIYTHLLVSPTPIKGPVARLHQAETYGLNTAILRTNKQIHDEARTVFLGRNTFSINSLPRTTTTAGRFATDTTFACRFTVLSERAEDRGSK
jgi:hypothetical protein